MNKILLAVAMTTVFSMPALARPGTERSHQAVAPYHSEIRAKHSDGQVRDPYWKPCHFSRFGGMNTCSG
jgi:hypothetical protein